MSRLAKKPIVIPTAVELKVDKATIVVKGPFGSNALEMAAGIELKIEKNNLIVSKNDLVDDATHGLFWSLIQNLIIGVDKGFEKKLTLIGVGFRAAVAGNLLDLQVGFSHPTKLEIPQDLKIKVEKATTITVSGVDKQKVGQFAAKIREIKPPEPYKGKGIRYENEFVRKKAGKAAKGKGA